MNGVDEVLTLPRVHEQVWVGIGPGSVTEDLFLSRASDGLVIELDPFVWLVRKVALVEVIYDAEDDRLAEEARTRDLWDHTQ